MNDASKAILRWLMQSEGQAHDETELFLSALERGTAKREQDALEMHAKLMIVSRMKARGTEHEESIERLFELHEKLAVLAIKEEAAVALGQAATILEKPPKSDLEARIKANLLRKAMSKFETEQG
ncbi:hypothetical protein G6L37_04415 [Agrobacterium rubi]|nr:hypothetical protein [Agrobacterium rubi]NTF24596.1 hypothetical protein [Agrobacterium rubi]